MFYSMTGYANTTLQLPHKLITIEIKTLNGKNMDLSLKAPYPLRNYEAEIRSLATEKIIRGKTDLTIQVDYHPDFIPAQINKTIVNRYLRELSAIAEENAIPAPDLLSVAIRIPGALDTEEEEIAEEEWIELKKALNNCLDLLLQYREKEGERLKTDMVHRIKLLREHTAQIAALDPGRKEKIRSRLNTQLAAISDVITTNADRLEQELIYYLEKINITEELVRLDAHYDYFEETINNKNAAEKGKKLSFIAQEIGREVNTIGSKAADAAIQRLVVMMKDELEKIKEQLYNVL